MTHSSRRSFLAGSLLAGLYSAAGSLPAARALAAAASEPPLSWRNWSGGQIAQSVGRFAPASEPELAAFLRQARRVRPVGAGHSFSPLVPTDGHLLILDRLAGLVGHDRERHTATFAAGTRLADMGKPLQNIGQGMLNLPDIDRQTLAGATATATHGTGIEFTNLSAYVTALRLVTPSGEILEVSAENDPQLFDAARVGLGALGVVTRLTLQNRGSYRLKEMTWVQRTDEVLEEFDARVTRHRHFEMFPLTHSDYALVLAIDETDEPIDNPPTAAEEEAAFGEAMRHWLAVPPGERRALINGMAEQIEPSQAVDHSFRILANVRNNRFNEMEYSVPLAAGAACLREILSTIAEREIDVVFPLEYRYVQGDALWLSMFEGGPRAAISIHHNAGLDYRPYFDAIEPIFWKYGGRPHWGKLHSLGAPELERLYPRFRDFVALRAELDPTGKLLNHHLAHLFGVVSELWSGPARGPV
jgi:FAD-linked oxidoreductase